MQVLAKHPRYLNRFYKDESQFTLTWRNHGVPDTRETVSTTEVGSSVGGEEGEVVVASWQSRSRGAESWCCATLPASKW